jgi:D-amino peptidase
MKVFISCDMEGISGVTGPDDVDPRKEAYQRFRRIMTGDVNAAIEGALAGGADEFLVNDSHNGMRNILIEELNPRADLISGSTKPNGMMQGIDSSFELALFVGYHAMSGTQCAVMDHTIYPRMVDGVRINGQSAGEAAISAGVAGYFGVSIGAVTGDDKIAQEAINLLGHVETAIVKQGLDRYVAKCLPLQRSRTLISNAAKKAVQRREEFKPLRYKPPVKFEVRLATTTQAALASSLPTVTVEDSRTVSLSSQDYIEAFHTFLSLLELARTTVDEIFG